MRERKTSRSPKQFIIRGCLGTIVFGPFTYQTEKLVVDSRLVSDVKKTLKTVKNGNKVPTSWNHQASAASTSEVLQGMKKKIYNLEMCDGKTVEENLEN
jgi:hypothetical protein